MILYAISRGYWVSSGFARVHVHLQAFDLTAYPARVPIKHL